MRLLLDTQLLLWAAVAPSRINRTVQRMINDDANELIFSVVSIWETTIKAHLGRADFTADPRQVRIGLLDSGYRELQVTAEHALAVGGLPLLHRDPFDRLLLAQARHEGATFVTADQALAAYPVPTHLA